MLEFLGFNGIDLIAKNLDGNTPLHYSVRMGFHECSEVLIKLGADEAIENNQGLTPWQMAS
jgi:ankyrin repeat protein